jgi:X-Pro dipeptidyl-peptidase
MKNLIRTSIALIFVLLITLSGQSQQNVEKTKVPVVVDGKAQVIPAFEDHDSWIRHDLWVETEFDSDGDGKLDRMHVDVTRPSQTDTEGLKLPVIYASSPYYAGTASGRQWLWDVRQELNSEPPERRHAPVPKARINRPIISNSEVEAWVPRGFIVVHSSSPGTGLSEGCPTVGGDNESLAPKAVIDWLNGRAKGYTGPDSNEEVKAYWSTGKVGMTGTSYNGTLPLAAATTGVDGLEVIIPIAPNTSYYHYYRSNGLIRHPGGWLGEDIDYLYDFIHTGNPARYEWCNDHIRKGEMYENFDRVYGDYNEFWAGRDYLNDLEPLKCAVLMSHAFNDWNVVPIHSWRISKALKEKGVPVQMFYHQGSHGGGPPFDMINEWFTHYLFGAENNIQDGPKAWIVRENDDRDNPTPYADYPNPDAEDITFYLAPGAPKQGMLNLDNSESKGKEILIDNVSFSGSALAQAEWTEHRLIYLTPELNKDIHISGVPSITIKAASSKPAVNLSVWLVSLPWQERRNARITDNLITRGWADLQNYKSLWEGEPLVPGKFYEMTFDLQPDDQVIPAGQQIGLMIFSSDREFTLWPEPGTELSVDLEGTTLTLPVVGGREAYEEAMRDER